MAGLACTTWSSREISCHMRYWCWVSQYEYMFDIYLFVLISTRSSDPCKVWDNLLGVLSLTRSRFSSNQHRLILFILIVQYIWGKSRGVIYHAAYFWMLHQRRRIDGEASLIYDDLCTWKQPNQCRLEAFCTDWWRHRRDQNTSEIRRGWFFKKSMVEWGRPWSSFGTRVSLLVLGVSFFSSLLRY